MTIADIIGRGLMALYRYAMGFGIDLFGVRYPQWMRAAAFRDRQTSRTPFVALSTVPPRFLLFAHWEKPRFQDRAAKEYLLEYDSFVDRFKYAYRALKAGNIAGYQCLFAEAEILREKATTLRPRLSAEEQKEMDRYQQIRATELPVASNR
jgi:hypothetical protein